MDLSGSWSHPHRAGMTHHLENNVNHVNNITEKAVFVSAVVWMKQLGLIPVFRRGFMILRQSLWLRLKLQH